jgi:1-acyl-sn-glycerol-3-phosphate acyltransferase
LQADYYLAMAFLRKIYVGWWFLVFASGFLILYPLFLVLLCHPRLYKMANLLRRIWAFMHCMLTGILPFIIRSQKQTGPAIYCANHFSYMDIVMSVLVIPGNLCFMAKTELNHIPLFDIFFKTVDISVNRRHAGESYDALQAIGQRFKEGYNLVIFPEGTIHGKAPHLGPFKSGPFRLAVQLNAPVVPVTFPDNFKRFDIDTTFGGSPGIARAIIHPAVTGTDAQPLKMRTLALIQKDLETIYGHHTGTD